MKLTFFPRIILFILAIFFSSHAMAGQKVDNRIYEKLLQEYVSPAGQVNYRGFKIDETRLDQYLSILSETDPESLNRTEQFAFYINTYNAFTIKLILSKYPGINSIKETGTFFTNPWQKKFIRLNGRTVTLDHIEHQILRHRFKDPRVHFAINCASKGCPKLRNEPYEPEKLEIQLNEQTRAFINNPKKNFYTGGNLFLSRIFKWFDDDFGDNPVRFIRQYADGELKNALSTDGQDVKIKYLDYDWSLNQ